MPIDLRQLAPGELPNDVFTELVEHNNYSPDMVEALRDHLVHGKPVKEAIKAHGVAPNKFKMRLVTLQEEIMRIGRVVALITGPEAKPSSTSVKKRQQSLDELHKLSSELTTKIEALRGQG